MALVVKNQPANAGDVRLEKGMTTHSSILAWRIPWTDEPGRLQSIGSRRVRHKKRLSARTHTHTHTHTNPLRGNWERETVWLPQALGAREEIGVEVTTNL